MPLPVSVCMCGQMCHMMVARFWHDNLHMINSFQPRHLRGGEVLEPLCYGLCFQTWDSLSRGHRGQNLDQ